MLLMWQSSPLSLPPPGASMGEMSKLPVGPSAKSGVRPQRVTARLEDKHRLGEGVSHSPGWSWGGGSSFASPTSRQGALPPWNMARPTGPGLVAVARPLDFGFWK